MLIYAEDKLGIKKKNICYITLGTLVYFFVGLSVVTKIFSTLYLLYKSACLFYSINGVEHKQIIIDWSIYGMFSLIEIVTDCVSCVIPFYNFGKLLVLLWLFSDYTQGSSKIYVNYIEPYLQNNDKLMLELEKKINEIYKKKKIVDMEKITAFVGNIIHQ